VTEFLVKFLGNFPRQDFYPRILWFTLKSGPTYFFFRKISVHVHFRLSVYNIACIVQDSLMSRESNGTVGVGKFAAFSERPKAKSVSASGGFAPMSPWAGPR